MLKRALLASLFWSSLFVATNVGWTLAADAPDGAFSLDRPQTSARPLPNDNERPHAARNSRFALATKHVSERDYRRAFQLYKEVLATDRRTRNLPGQAEVLRAIGSIYEETGRTGQALKTFQAALTLYRELGDRGGEGTCLHHLGLLHQYSGKFAEAAKLYQEALARCTEVGDLAGEAFCIGGLAFLDTTQGNYAEALSRHQRALKLFERAGDKRGQGITLNDIGLSYSAMGSHARAAKYYQCALTIAEELGDPVGKTMVLSALVDHYQHTGNWTAAIAANEEGLELATAIGHRSAEAIFLGNLAQAASAQGEHLKSLDYKQNALAIHREVGNQFTESALLASMAMSYLSLEREREAREHLERAAWLSRVQGNSDVLSWCLTKQGMLNAGAGSLSRELAARQLAEAIDLLEQMSLGLSTQSKSTLHGRYAQAYEVMIGLLIDEGRTAEAWGFAERARSQAFLQLLGNRRISAHDAPPELLGQRAELDGKMRALVAAPASLKTARNLSLLKESYGNLLEEMWATCPEVVSMQQVRAPNVRDVQAALGPDQLLVEFYIGEKQSWVWTVSSTQVSAYPLAGTRATFASHVSRARAALSIHDAAEASSAMMKLSHLVLSPIAKQLRSRKRLLIAPHQALHYIPFSVLGLEETVLLESHSIELVTSAATWLLGHGDSKVSNTRIAIAALGNVDTVIATAGSELPPVGQKIEPLPGTLREAHVISQLFSNHELITERRMTREAIQLAASRAGIVHIATHAALDPDSPLFSGLITANGLITVADLLDWRLDARLVVLSACNTAVGRLGGGDEIVGMTRSLRYAGSDQVLATLWPVSDEVTAIWMEAFYRQVHAGTSFTEAARTASLQVRRDHPAPFFWAPFVLMN